MRFEISIQPVIRMMQVTFVQKYQIKYIIVGQLERIVYPGIGLDKFDDFDGIFWEKVFEYGDTKIYHVII